MLAVSEAGTPHPVPASRQISNSDPEMQFIQYSGLVAYGLEVRHSK